MKLYQELASIESDYSKGSITLTAGLHYSQHGTLKTIEFYSNSRYLNTPVNNFVAPGLVARDLPFYNIVNAMVDTAVVATDIDTKDIRVEADKEGDYDKSWLFNHEIQEWMKQSNFARTLNEMGETRARYGGVLVKKWEEKGEMELQVVEWKNAITDPCDILGGAIVERHYLNPIQLREKDGIWSNISEAMKLYSKKGYTRSDTRMEIWEVHGQFPEGYNTEDEEADPEDKYTQQVHFYAKKESKFVHLYWAEEKEMPYKYLPWKKVAGRALGRGVVEEGEEAQVWTNDAIQKEQAAMELSGKVILKTNSKKIGNNVLTDLDNGSIVVLEDNKDLNVLNLLNGAMPQFQNMVEKWFKQYERSTSSYDAVRGETPPSGQPYRLQALVSQAGGSHFDYRREEWGIFITELFTDWVFPHIEKKLSRAHILASDFSPEELTKIDEHFAKFEAYKHATDKILNGEKVTAEDYASLQEQFKQSIGKTAQRRFLDIPEGYYKGMSAKLSLNITGENKNKTAALDSLNSLLQTMIPLVQSGIAKAEDVQLIINKITEISGSGLSPFSLSKPEPKQPQQGMPQMGQPQPMPQLNQPAMAQ